MNGPICLPPVYVVSTIGAPSEHIVGRACDVQGAVQPVAMFFGGNPAICREEHRPRRLLWFDCARQRFACDEIPLALTDYDFALLALLVAGGHRTWLTAEIRCLVWGRLAPTAPDGAVRIAVHRLRRKLGAAGYSIQTVRTVGYRYAPDTAAE